MTRKQRRLTMIAAAVGVLGLAAGLVMAALKDNIQLFVSPTEFLAKAPAAGTRLRLGGLVKPGSLVRGAAAGTSFAVTDNKTDVQVTYVGTEHLPDLFREGQGVIAEGAVAAAGVFASDRVLAKHDENYISRDVADALKKEGMWQGEKAGK